ncbi:MAG: PfkB family carbohydrate kinase [Candidatus Liptonbacteria bacterium]
MNNIGFKIAVISSLAKDVFLNKNRVIKIEKGGPAFWIEKILKKLNMPYRIFLAKPNALVKIHMPEEFGEIVSLGEAKIPKSLRADITIVSTIGNELSLSDLEKINGSIALDVQGFVRYLKGAKKFILPQGLSGRVKILKATKQEMQKVSEKLIRDQKNRILIVTNGARGFEVLAGRKKHKFLPKKINPSDTVGAGDVLLASFVVNFMRTQNPKSAGEFALGYVARFISSKK